MTSWRDSVTLAYRRIAVIGGCGGIGRAVVAALQADGARVAVLDLPASLNRHPPEQAAAGIPLDATDAGQVDGAFGVLARHWDGLDGLINLCGFTADTQPIDGIDETDWDAVIAGNLKAAYLIARAARPCLAQGQRPALVNMASGLGAKPAPGHGPYGAAKAGVIAMTRTLALEWAPEIRVNAVAPSAVDTAFLRGGTGRSNEDGATNLDIDTYTKTIPLGRIAAADDVVGPTLFLLSDAAGYVTGQTLHVNGGVFMN